MKVRLLAVLLLLLAPVLGGAAEGAELRSALAEERLAGAVWSLVSGDEVRIGAAGRSNAATGAPMHPAHRVQVGSVTKTLLALGLMRLASEGRLDLDAPVARILPGLAFDNPWAGTDPVRVRHLLDHTAGLEDARLWQMFSAATPPDMPLAEALTRDRSMLRIRTRPGERFSYSNVGYTVAGLIVERLTGERYEAWLDRELLRPLGMDASSFAFTSQTGPRADPRLAWGHNDDLSLQPALPIALRPAGQFTTDARDMGRLARFLMGNGAIGGRPFIRAELLRAMGRPAGTAAARAGLEVGYALGLGRRDREGMVGLCHAGSVAGWYAMLCLYPEQRKAYFLAVNTDSEDADYGSLNAVLMRSLALRASRPPAPARLPENARAWTGRYAPAPPRFGLLAYADLLSGTVRLDAAADGLRLGGLGAPAAFLRPAGGALYRADGRVLPSHALLRDDDGTALLATGTQTYRRIGPGLFWGLWVSLALGVAGLAWMIGAGFARLWRNRGRSMEPGTLVVLAFVVPAALLARQPFTSLGDLTAGSAALWAASAALPPLAAWHAARAYRRRPRAWLADLAAAAAGLQLCAVLAGYGLLPLALWK